MSGVAYTGGYLLLDEVTKEQSNLLASSACVIGMSLTIAYDEATSSFFVSTETGEALGTVRPRNKSLFREAIDEGWTCRAWLSLVYYDNSLKRFGAEIVYQLYKVDGDSATQQAFDSYAQATSRRIASGSRPNVSLSSKECDSVAANGDWSDDKSVALPVDTSRGGGKVIYKRKRSLSDRMIAAAIDRRPGCMIAAIVFAVAIIIAVVLIVASCSGGR